jgi:DNA-binding transcriptional LysR family regulator
VLGPNIHAFLREHPGITVDMMVTSATPNLIRDRIDVAIMLHEQPKSKLSHVLLAVSPREICASPGYLARYGTPTMPEDLDGHQCLSSRFSGVAESWAFIRGAETWIINVKSRLLSDNGDILRQACLAGAGIGNFYRFHVLDDLREGRLVRVLPEFTPRPKDIYAVIPHRQLLRPQTKAFIEFATQAVASRDI